MRTSPRLSVVRFATALSVAVGALGLPACPIAARQQSSVVGALLRGRIEALRATGEARAGGERLLARDALPAFYEARGFEPAWSTSGGPELLEDLASAIRGAAEHGLDPSDYHLRALETLRATTSARPDSSAALVDLELLASDAFLVLGSHLLQGRVSPETVDPEWLANRRSATLEEVLADAMRTGRIDETLQRLAPQQVRYQRMVEAAQRLRDIARGGGWPNVPPGARLEVGMQDARVGLLRARLWASRDLVEDTGEGGETFDEPLAQAIRRFQARHGLEVDGVVGPATVSALNVSAADRARQIEINLERWRWLPSDLGSRHIEVNIAGFDVKVVENGRVVQEHRAVVGRQYRQTPMFSATMTYIVLSPYWHVPPSIAAADKLPLIKANPGALADQHIALLDQATNQAIDPLTVDWAAMTGAELNRRYRLRQEPGPYNALGAVKFMFPNRHNVYLHDTPSRELFERSSRGFSSGCIRIDHPLDLAEYLLRDQPEWTRGRIEAVAAGGVERTVRLTQGVPVHLLYWTAWADPDGTMQFRDDIYDRDQTVWRALSAPPPTS